MAKKPIKITEVVLRDAHQSLLATRMTMDEMRPILPEMDKIPYFSVEGVFRARESPRWCTRKSRNECCGFFVAPFPSGRTRTSRKRSCSSRGDWSLKMAAGLWAGATIKRERKRGANNVRRALRTTARAVLRSKMEALQADKRTGLNS